MKLRLPILSTLLFTVLFFASVLTANAYDQGIQSCGFVKGTSELAVGGDPDSGRNDFDRADWSPDPADPGGSPTVYSTIADADKVCFTPEGTIDGAHQWFWNSNAGWVDLNWSGTGTDVTVDLAGDGYWSGFAWSDNFGWIAFDWDCPGCDLTQRVHTELPDGWPDLSDTDLMGDVEGYAWSDRVGWINFGNSTDGAEDVVMELPVTPEDFSVTPQVWLVPDPFEVTQYGQGGTTPAPRAGLYEDYELHVKLINTETGETVTSNNDYRLTIDPVQSVDSGIYRDQINRYTKDDLGFNYETPTYTNPDGEYVVYLSSFAPTSNMNGYDEDGDGVIDLCWDRDPNDETKKTPSCTANQWVMEALNLTVEPVEGSQTVTIVEDPEEPAPLWGLDYGTGSVDFKFAPPMEVISLFRETGEAGAETFVDRLSSAVNEVQTVKGFVAVDDSYVGDEFDVKYVLTSDDYNFLFDGNNDGSYLPTDPADKEVVTSSYSITAVGEQTELDEWASKTDDYIPLTATDYFVTTNEGSLGGDVMIDPMLVNDNGYTAFVADEGSNFWEHVKNFFSSVFFAQGGGADLTVYDIRQYNDSGGYYGYMTNQGIQDADWSVNGMTWSWEDGAQGFSYSWTEFTGYLEVGGIGTHGSTVDDPTVPVEVEVCVDYLNRVVESDESNNCLTKILVWGQEDLTVTDVYKDAYGNLKVDLKNLGESPVFENSVKLWVHVNGVLEYEGFISDFIVPVNSYFEPGEDHTAASPDMTVPVQNGDVVDVCIDPENILSETEEGNNCMSIVVSTITAEGPGYSTEIWYVDNPEWAEITFSYYSAYLPREEGLLFNVPAYDHRLDPVIVGSITSVAEEELLIEEEYEAVSDLPTIEIRNELFQRFSQATKGIRLDTSDTNWNVVDGALVPKNVDIGYGTELLDGELIYFKGDTVIEDLDDSYDQKTIVVSGGDLYIDSNMLDAGSAVGLIVFKDTATNAGGNVYIRSDVTDLLNVSVYADESIYRYDSAVGLDGELPDWADRDERRDYLKSQLYISGSLISYNTVLGFESMKLPDGSTTTDENKALELSTGYDSEYVLCWIQAMYGDTEDEIIPVDYDNDGSYEDAEGNPDLGDMEYCTEEKGFVRAQSVVSTGDLFTSENAPVTIKYAPTPDDLPIFSGEVSF